jgi:hypothetical protein
MTTARRWWNVTVCGFVLGEYALRHVALAPRRPSDLIVRSSSCERTTPPVGRCFRKFDIRILLTNGLENVMRQNPSGLAINLAIVTWRDAFGILEDHDFIVLDVVGCRSRRHPST